MRKYLANLHQKPEAHKKRFAFVTSACVTLIIFAIWGAVNFGPAQAANQPMANQNFKEVSPVESLGSSMASTLEALGEAWQELKNGFGGVEFKSETYGE